MKENSRKEDIKILEEIIKGDEDCISAIYSQMKVKNDNDEDIQYFKKEKQAIEHILSDYKRVLKKNEELKNQEATQRKINELLVQRYSNSI